MADIQPFAGLNQEQTQQALSGLLEEICIRLADIADSAGNLMPDAAGRLRVTAEAVASVNTVTNQSQIGGLFANQQIIALTQISEAQLRSNIKVS